MNELLELRKIRRTLDYIFAVLVGIWFAILLT